MTRKICVSAPQCIYPLQKLFHEFALPNMRFSKITDYFVFTRDYIYATARRPIYTVSKKTGPLGYSKIFPTDLDQCQ